MKEKVLSPENRRILKGGLTFSKVEILRQQYLNPTSSSTSEEPGLKICRDFIKTIYEITYSAKDRDYVYNTRQAAELWVFHNYGPEAVEIGRKYD